MVTAPISKEALTTLRTYEPDIVKRAPFSRLLSTLLPAKIFQPKTVDFGELLQSSVDGAGTPLCRHRIG